MSLHCSMSYPRRSFSDAVFDIFNSDEVLIDNSTFTNNKGHGRVNAPNRGNTGAVAIGYHDMNTTVNSSRTVTVTGSYFVDNCANVSNSSLATSTRVLTSQSYKGRGAGMGVFLGDSSNQISVSVEGCSFVNNSGFRSGGGLYVAFDGENTNHTVTVSRSLFLDNNSGGRGGGLLLAFLSSGDPTSPMLARVSDTEFVGNDASTGGGVAAIPADATAGLGVRVVLENCTFVRNSAAGFGGALRFAVFNTFSDRVSLQNHEVISW